jgi:hypothetical protein
MAHALHVDLENIVLPIPPMLILLLMRTYARMDTIALCLIKLPFALLEAFVLLQLLSLPFVNFLEFFVLKDKLLWPCVLLDTIVRRRVTAFYALRDIFARVNALEYLLVSEFHFVSWISVSNEMSHSRKLWNWKPVSNCANSSSDSTHRFHHRTLYSLSHFEQSYLSPRVSVRRRIE